MKTIIAGPLFVAAAYLRLAGQVSSVLDPGVTTLIGNLGVIGVLIWFLWYHTTHSQPMMMAKFAEELQKLRDERVTERAADEREKNQLRGMLIDSLRSDRRAVHDVRDVAQQSLLNIAAAAAHEKPEPKP